jgi:hypothetical protein
MADDFESRLRALELWRNGNGAIGAEKRLQTIEAQEDDMSCRTGQRLEKHITYHREQEGKQMDSAQWQKQMRIMVVGNLVGFSAVIVTLLIFALGG